MHVLGQRYIQGESEYDAKMEPPEDSVEAVGEVAIDPGAGKRLTDRTSDECVGMRAGPSGRNEERLRKQREEHQRRDEKQDDRRLAFLGEIEAESVGSDNPPAYCGPDQQNKEHQRQDVQIGGERTHASVRKQRRREIVPDHVAKDVQDVAGGEGEESPEDDEVSDARSVTERDTLQDFTLTQDVRERTEQAAHWLVEPTRVLAQENQAEDAMVENESRRGKYPDCK